MGIDGQRLPVVRAVRAAVSAYAVGTLALRKPAGRQLLLAGAIFAIPYPIEHRHAVPDPGAPFLSLALAMALNWEWLLLGLVVVARGRSRGRMY